MFEWFFAESYHKFDEEDPGRQLRQGRGEEDAAPHRRRQNDDQDGGFFSCDAMLAPCVGISGDRMLARTTTMANTNNNHTISSSLSRKSSVATLEDIENAVALNEWRATQSKMKLTTSTISKESQSTAPSNESETVVDDENNSSILTMDHHAKQQDWETFKEAEEERYGRRRRKMCLLLYILLVLLIVGSIVLGASLALQKKKARATTTDANQVENLPPTDEQGGGFDIVFGSTFAPTNYATDHNTEVPSGYASEVVTDEYDGATPIQFEDEENDPDFGVPALDMDQDRYDYTANTDYLVGVYYYPWHGSNFHNGDGYLRKELVPAHQPALGQYDDSRPDVIAQHMRWFRKANIGLLVTSWWGPDRLEDSNTKDVIMEHEDVGNLKIALHYETTGRIKGSDMSTTRSDMQYLCEHYFDHPNYYRIDGRPVLVIYITRRLHNEGLLEEALLTMRSEASKCGHNLYLIGDQVFASAPDPNEPFVPFWYFDAVTNYDVYGSSGRPSPYANRTSVDSFYAEQQQWREQALKENCRFIPPVSPGYNDRAVRLENNHPPLSRRLSATDEEGSLFWYQLTKALPLVDPEIDNMILVNSFNEWHEDTQIEPVVGTIPTSQPELYTGGLQYVPYGELYLDILQAATTKGAENMFNYFFDSNR